MKRVILTALLSTSLASAAAAQQQQQQTYTLTLPPDQVGTLVDGLLELPAKKMMPTYQAIISQIGTQNAARNAPLAAKPDEPKPAEEPAK